MKITEENTINVTISRDGTAVSVTRYLPAGDVDLPREIESAAEAALADFGVPYVRGGAE